MGLALILSVISTIPPLDSQFWTGKYLWAEDGPVFANKAYALGFYSLWETHAGYIHLYPRIIAYLASFFPLLYLPYIYLFAWYAIFFAMIFMIILMCREYKINLIVTICLVLLIPFQPAGNESFFNLVNSQWLCGVFLPLFVYFYQNKAVKKQVFGYVGLFIACFTGPFSAFLLPVMFLYAAFKKGLKNNPLLYLIVFLGGVTQSVLILTDARVPLGFSHDVSAWGEAFNVFLLFGAKTASEYSVVYLFWGLIVFSALLRLLHKNHSEKDKFCFFLMLYVLITIFAALYSVKDNPALMLLMSSIGGGGSRYTFIPYTLMLVSAVIFTSEHKKIQCLIIMSIFLICAVHYNGQIRAKNLQFKSYALFSQYKDIIIPIHPQWDKFPGWHINTKHIKRDAGNRQLKQYDYLMNSHTVINDTLSRKSFSKGALVLYANSPDSRLIFTRKIICPKARAVGLEIKMNRNTADWMQIFWSRNLSFNHKHSTRRFYNDGEIVAQFAFPYDESGVYIRFDPMENNGKAIIKNISIYCIP
ncbi:MAG: hypothetical protein QNK11_00580 [Legionella sp.]|nr:hypothetical protein [Legionella sp.]